MHSEYPTEFTTYTPVPDSILGEFLVDLQDEYLLRCFLRILWHLHKSKDKMKSVEVAVLNTDPVIKAVLSKRETTDLSRLSTALKEIYEFNLLLLVKSRQDDAKVHVALNTSNNLRMIEKFGWICTDSIEATRVPSVPSKRTNVFALYEQNIGLITPLVADELKDMENEYPVAWVEEAIQLSVVYNRKNIRYILRILERWRNEGRDGGSRRNSQTVGAKDYIERYGLSGN